MFPTTASFEQALPEVFVLGLRVTDEENHPARAVVSTMAIQ
jgi:hypothetical protein